MNMTAKVKLLLPIGLVIAFISGCSSSDSPPPTPPPEPFKAYLKASNTDADDLFGEAVAMSGDGNTIAIGAYAEDGDGSAENDNNADAAGAVYVFKRNPVNTGTWSQVAYVKAPIPAIGDEFGFSVALSEDGSVLAVGAPLADTAGPTADTGAVFVFSGVDYANVETVVASDATLGDRFGQSIALSDNGMYLAVGANTRTGAFSGDGAVYVYEDNGAGIWGNEEIFTAAAAATAEADAGFGTSVALDQDGSVLAVGAWREGNAPATIDFGAAYIFTRVAAVWSFDTRLPSLIANERAGTAVALNDAGDRLAVGAPGNTLGGGATPGKVYVYTFGATWTLDAGVAVEPSNGDNGDVFGASVALDSSGDALLVGAWLEDGAGTYIGTPDVANAAGGAGAAYRFERSATPTWDETEYIKATNTAAGDEFGSVAISDDGLHILMGASGEDSNATGVDGNQDNRDNTKNESGAAYFYDL